MVKADLSRGVINGYVDRIKRVFKWAAAQELVPGGPYHALAAVDPLRKGRSEARETEPVRPVPEAWVHSTMECMPPTVAAMTELAMLTGMRPGEVCILRPCDLDMRGKVWIYTPPTHKSEHFGHRRVVPIGPRGQEILARFLARATDAFCFSPAEVQAHRSALKRGERKTPVQPSQQNRRKARPKRTPGLRYDANSYRNAIEYAIAAANKAAKRKAESEGHEATENELVPHWHPHQLRHTAATIIRREMGLDAARALLGHRSLGITDTYAELDLSLAVETAKKLG
jgi:integrase